MAHNKNMSANSTNPTGTTPPVRLASPQESLIQFAFKLKNVVSHVRL